MPEPLITEKARAVVGREIELSPFAITHESIERFTTAYGDEHPLYIDPHHAASAGYSSVVAPPLLHLTQDRPLTRHSQLAADGVPVETRPEVPVGQGRSMLGEITIEFDRPLQVGDVIRGVRRLTSLAEKEGRTGRFVVATWETDYRDAGGERVLREARSQILY